MPAFFWIVIAFVVLAIALPIIDMMINKGVCEPVNKPQTTKKEIFVDKNGFINEVDVNDIPVFLKLHAGEYDDFYLEAENVTVI